MATTQAPLRLLAIFAHPDDETLGTGGTLARYADEGVEIFLVCATRGERGRYRGSRDGPDYPGMAGMARIREAELHAAARVLGLREVSLLDYVDGDLDQAEPAAAIAAIVHHVRRVRPHVAITFPPDGAYGHPDHVAISQFATAALVAAADPSYARGTLSPHAVAKLYYMVSTEGAWAAYQEAFKTLTVTVDGVERVAQPWPDWMITTVIDTRAHWERVWQAVTCHDSQVAGYETLRHLTPGHHEALWGTQSFYRAWSLVNGGRAREHDLFEGLRH